MKGNPLRRAVAWARRHRQTQETVALAIALDVAWNLIVAAGVFTAGLAAASTFSTPTIHPTMPLSQKGAAFLTRNEGLRLSPYNDPYNCTVGVGHLIHYGRCSSFDYYHWHVTYTQAMNLLMHDSGWAASCVHNRVTRRLSQAQVDALIDLSFNAGCGSLDYSGIARQINGGDLRGVPRTLSHTAVTASGRYLSGLYTRRLAEGRLFSTGYYGSGIGFYVAKPTKAPIRTNKLGYPNPIPDWAWRWAAWQLGHKPYRGHAHDPKLRKTTHAPRVIPKWAWRWFAHSFQEAK